MKAYSEELRQKIVAALERGMPKAQAASSASVSIAGYFLLTCDSKTGLVCLFLAGSEACIRALSTVLDRFYSGL